MTARAHWFTDDAPAKDAAVDPAASAAAQEQ